VKIEVPIRKVVIKKDKFTDSEEEKIKKDNKPSSPRSSRKALLPEMCDKMCEVMEMLVKNCAKGRNANYVNIRRAMPLIGTEELENGLNGQAAGGRMTAWEPNV